MVAVKKFMVSFCLALVGFMLFGCAANGRAPAASPTESPAEINESNTTINSERSFSENSQPDTESASFPLESSDAMSSSDGEIYLGSDDWPKNAATSSPFVIYDRLEDVPGHKLEYGSNRLTIIRDGNPWIYMLRWQPFTGGIVIANDSMFILQYYVTTDELSYDTPIPEGTDIHAKGFSWFYCCYDSTMTYTCGYLLDFSDKLITKVDGTRLMTDDDHWFDVSTGEWHGN